MLKEKSTIQNLETGYGKKDKTEIPDTKPGNPTLIADNNGRIIHFNSAFRELTGYSAEEIEGRHLLEVLLSAVEAELTVKKFMEALENGETLEIEREYQITPQEYRQVRFFIMAVPGLEGEAGKIVCVGTEIPEEKSTLKITFETAMDGTIIDISPSIEKISGYKREELLNKPFKVSYYNPSDRTVLLDQLMKTGSVSNFETIINDKDDNKNVCSITASLVRAGDGSPLKIVGHLNIIEKNHKFIDALLETERKYHELANSLPEVIFEIDQNGFFTFVNENALATFGYTNEDLANCLHVLETLAQKDRDRARENITRAFATGKVDDAADYEYTAMRKDGSTFPCYIRSRPILKDGRVIGLRGILFNISDRKVAEDLLKLEEARLEALLKLGRMTDSSEEEICKFVLDEAVKLTESEVGFLGFVDDEEKNLSISNWSGKVMNCCTIDNADTVFPIENAGLWAEAIRTRQPQLINQYDLPHDAKKGLPEGHFPLQKLLTVPIIQDGRVMVLAGVANKKIDYTETDSRQLTLLIDGLRKHLQRKRANEALIFSEELFSRIFYTSPIPTILSTVEDGIIVKANRAFIRLTGYPGNQLIGKSCDKLWAYPNDRESAIEFLKEKGVVDSYRIKVRKATGENRTCLISAVLVDFGEKPHLIALLTDITDKKETEKILREKNEELKAAMAVKSDFLSMVSHELRTPLVPILGYTELILDGTFGVVPQGLREPLETILGRAESLRMLIEDLLQLSRLEQGHVEIKPERVPLTDFLPGIINSYNEIDQGKPVKIEWEGPEISLRADPRRLEQVLRNLIDNSIKYSNDSVRIILRTGGIDGMGYITVSDDGIGISGDHLSHIFEHFYQVEPIDTRAHSGTGLGLAISKELVEDMGGFISVESVPGAGSDFTVALPIANIADSRNISTSTDKADSKIRSERKIQNTDKDMKPTVLVIDDDKFTIRLLEMMLGENYSLLSALNATDGLNMVLSNEVSLILLDWMMPGTDGLSFLGFLKSKPETAKIPVILISGKTERESIEMAFTAGADDFISKPFKRDDLLTRLSYICNSRD